MFVSHRVGEIQTLTEPEEWRFIPGRLNPADEAMRSSIEEEALSARWWDGLDQTSSGCPRSSGHQIYLG